MAYKRLKLPENTPDEMRSVIKDSVDPRLKEVRPHLLSPKQRGGVEATHLLLEVVSGVSVTLYMPKGFDDGNLSGKAFVKLLTKYFPWNCEPEGQDAVTGREAAEILYTHYRIPLAHRMGRFESYGGAQYKVAKGKLRGEDLRVLEHSEGRPLGFGPTLKRIGTKRLLLVKALYWGVRQMIVRLVEDKVNNTDQIAQGRFEGITYVFETRSIETTSTDANPKTQK